MDEHHDGNSCDLPAGQIIFLACGLITVAFSVPVWLYLPDSPAQATFLTQHEKDILIERLQNGQGNPKVKRTWVWDQVSDCFLDIKTWCWVAMHTALA